MKVQKRISIIAIFLLFFFNWLSSITYGQQLNISVYTSFHANCKSTVECMNDSCRLYIKLFERTDTANIIWHEENIVPLKKCKSLFDYFANNLNLKDTILPVLDGFIVVGQYNNGNDVRQFKFSTPIKNTNENEFFNQYLNVFNKASKSRKTKKYIKALKRYY